MTVWFEAITFDNTGGDWQEPTRKIWIRGNTRRELEDRVARVFHSLPEDVRLTVLGLIRSKEKVI